MKLDDLSLEMDYFDFDEIFYQKVNPSPLRSPYLISYSKDVCDLISLDFKECEKEDFVKFLNGEKTLKGSRPFAMAYSGHQFGHFVPNLGDGRAINLGKINGYYLQTKGSGLTKFSRQGDGRAVLRSSIREFIISEAMHALNIPTTRALALLGSKHNVYRNYLEAEKGAVVLRVASSWIRIGTFEFFANNENSEENLKKLADYVIKQSYKELINEEQKYEKFFYSLVDKTAYLMASWQVYGFMHGVMNTDNMSVAGLSIDYGPFAFMDYFKRHQICNHTDCEGRYSYNNQPYIAKWNLEVLAKALSQIADENSMLEYLHTFFHQYEKAYLELMNKRLGFDVKESFDLNKELIVELLNTLERAKTDYNSFFYELTKLDSFENVENILDTSLNKEALLPWLKAYEKKVLEKGINKELMKKTNPKYIIKNYMLQEAIQKAQEGDNTLVNDLLKIAQNPFLEHKEFEKYSLKAPLELANLQLSCSS